MNGGSDLRASRTHKRRLLRCRAGGLSNKSSFTHYSILLSARRYLNSVLALWLLHSIGGSLPSMDGAVPSMNGRNVQRW